MRESRWVVAVGAAVGLGTLCYLLAMPPTLNPADESFILYGARRVLEGQALYHDFFEFLTPGSFYLYALAYAIGGVSITSARTLTALANAVSAVCTFALTLQVASIWEAVLAGLLVPVLCVPTWNMAGHHWLATALGLAPAAVLFAPVGRGPTRVRPAAAGALAGLLLCTHQTRGMYFLPWLVVAVPGLAWTRADAHRWSRAARELGWTALGGAAVCIPLLGYAVWRSSFHEMYYATYMWVVTNYRGSNVGKFRWAANLFPGLARYSPPIALLQAIPWLFAIEAVALAWGVWRHGFRSQVGRLAMLGLALSAVGSILYFPDVPHIAFILPLILPVVFGMVYRLRQHLAGRSHVLVRRLGQLAWVLALVAVVQRGWSMARMSWEDHPVFFETAFGRIAGSETEAQTFAELRALFPNAPTSRPRLYSYSTDADVYLKLPADNPTRFALLRPHYDTPEQIQEAIDAVRRDPKVLVLVNIFGLREGDPFLAFLKSSYHEVAGLGPRLLFGAPLFHLYAPGAPP
jgi:hypothetical protein